MENDLNMNVKMVEALGDISVNYVESWETLLASSSCDERDENVRRSYLSVIESLRLWAGYILNCFARIKKVDNLPSGKDLRTMVAHLKKDLDSCLGNSLATEWYVVLEGLDSDFNAFVESESISLRSYLGDLNCICRVDDVLFEEML